MGNTLFLFSHQLHPDYLSAAQLNKNDDTIVLVDSHDQWTYYQFHKQRLLLHLSAMHHYVSEMTKQGWRIHLLVSPTLIEALKPYPNLIMFMPTNHYEQAWTKTIQPKTLLQDPLFLIDSVTWPKLLPKGKSWKLDPLYRQFRQQFHILMNADQPEGGQYSYDIENRKPPTKDLHFIAPIWFEMDSLTKKIKNDILIRFASHPGHLDTFGYPVTRSQALKGLLHFIDYRLATFGDHQDAMLIDQPWMSHSLISSSINLGLLSPHEVIIAAEQAYRSGKVPLAATEGFIRQILGWREYVRGIYLVLGPDYLTVNHFQHHRALPEFYYTGNTDMQCLKTIVHETLDYAYNHHIQRLMVLSNYANLAEVDPAHVNRWFNEMYIDASEWVVAANVLGMGLHADGGKMATKPYVASGAYIDKMSDYCDHCSYQVTLKTGKKACPFNSLYWHYIAKNQAAFVKNPRMGMMVKVFHNMEKQTQVALIQQAKDHLL
jgi:deoxyribodipyrimidine photolyase-related protein